MTALSLLAQQRVGPCSNVDCSICGRHEESLACWPTGICKRMTCFNGRAQGEWLTDISIEQVDVGGEREGGGVVSEPPLYLHGVAALCEQHRGACVAKGMEPHPGQARLLSGWLKYAPEDVALHQRRSVARREDESLVLGPLRCVVMLTKRHGEGTRSMGTSRRP